VGVGRRKLRRKKERKKTNKIKKNVGVGEYEGFRRKKKQRK
jgi:hypothetical protein